MDMARRVTHRRILHTSTNNRLIQANLATNTNNRRFRKRLTNRARCIPHQQRPMFLPLRLLCHNPGLRPLPADNEVVATRDSSGLRAVCTARWCAYGCFPRKRSFCILMLQTKKRTAKIRFHRSKRVLADGTGHSIGDALWRDLWPTVATSYTVQTNCCVRYLKC